MNRVVEQLLLDKKIVSLLQKSEEGLILNELGISLDNTIEPLKLARLVYLLITNIYSDKNYDDKELSKKAYLLLRNIDINNENHLNNFSTVCGIDGLDSELLYFFYIAAVSLQNDSLISIRLDLLSYSQKSLLIDITDWKYRLLDRILNSFVLLARKKNGFKDIRQAITIIEELRKEQLKFEEDYLKNNDLDAEIIEASLLLGVYHLSKAIVETATFLIEGYNYKKRIDAEIRLHLDVAKKLLYPEPRLIGLSDILEYSLKSLADNSIWKKTSMLSDKVKKLCKFQADLGKIDLLPSQRQALSKNMLDVASNVVVLQMPTSAGKSLLAEFNILVTKALRPDAKIVYVVPSRALVNQVYFDLKMDLEDLDLKIEKTSSAIEVDPNENTFLVSENIDIIVSTPEKLDLLIRRNHPSVEDVSMFVIDEAHTIQNGERGARLELLLTLLRRERPNSKFMLLSPFIKNAGDTLVEWLGGGVPIKVDWKPAEKLILGVGMKSKKKVKYFTYETMQTPYSPWTASYSGSFQDNTEINSKSPKDQILEYSVKKLTTQDKTQLVLCWGKTTANKRAQFIYEKIDNSTIHPDVSLVIKFIEDEVGRSTILTEVLKKGICTHHSGLSDETKLLLEHLIRNRHIQYVCSTTSIAEGVNFPVSSVFFDDFRRGSVGHLSVNDFWNISGRAGRTLVDNVGKIIIPFNSTTNKNRIKELIKDSANDLASVLSRLFIDADRIIALTQQDKMEDLFRDYYEALNPLIQYFIHLISVGGHESFVSEIEDLFKDSFEYYLLQTEQDKNKFISLCKTIYLSLQNKYSKQSGLLAFADKTGFSVPSVLQVMKAKSASDSKISDLDSWVPNILFNENDPSNLTEKIRVISTLRETKLGSDSEKSPFNPEVIAKILIGWVKGENYEKLSHEHPHYASKEDEKRINEFVTKMNDIRFKSSWGLSALEGIVRGKEDEIRDSYIPSFVYYGVEDEKSLALRMVGVPRMLSRSMSQMIEKDISQYSFEKLRKDINGLTDKDWDALTPKSSKLNSSEWKHVAEILVK